MANFNLPLATAGRSYDFFDGHAGRPGSTCILIPQGGNIFQFNGISFATSISSMDVRGEGFSSIRLVCVNDGEWLIQFLTGTWIFL